MRIMGGSRIDKEIKTGETNLRENVGIGRKQVGHAKEQRAVALIVKVCFCWTNSNQVREVHCALANKKSLYYADHIFAHAAFQVTINPIITVSKS